MLLGKMLEKVKANVGWAFKARLIKILKDIEVFCLLKTYIKKIIEIIKKIIILKMTKKKWLNILKKLSRNKLQRVSLIVNKNDKQYFCQLHTNLL